MVNSVDFSNRVKKILDYYQLTAAHFAEEIGVQRSSISHIISGRNKPSLDFVIKVSERFPEVDLYWLLNGTGTFPKNTTTSLPDTEHIHESTPPKGSDTAKKITKIVVFYQDGTFDEYHKE